MRRFLLSGTAAIALMGGVAQAGGLADPVMTAEVVRQETSSSSGGLIVPLLFLLVIAAVASGGGGGGVPVAQSDRRIKTDISWVGMTADALPVYRYRYLGTATRFEGVMAQDVLARRPDAVLRADSGLLAVDYAKLGLTLRVLH